VKIRYIFLYKKIIYFYIRNIGASTIMNCKKYIIDNKKILLRDLFYSLGKSSTITKLATSYFYLNGYSLVSESLKNVEKTALPKNPNNLKLLSPAKM